MGDSDHTHPVKQFSQMEFNQKVVDVLDQLAQEMGRQRKGSTLSNLAGVERDVRSLRNWLIYNEGVFPVPFETK